MTRFGKYELLTKIGEGGMAEVHLARTSGGFGTEKLLVLKRLLPELARTPRFVRMFLDEARLAVRLHHANIVQVYEADETEGVAFYAMEFLHGRDVRELMREVKRQGGRLPLDHAIAIVLSMCAALHYAHELVDGDGRPLGVVHRDVSPHNVFVLYDGVIKVIDFGIAKAATSGDRTATGMLKGKFGYMSPEQCLQQPVDRRSDVFCVGIMLWELTTGQRLYKAPSEYQMIKAIVERSAMTPRSVDPEYPPALEAIVMKALKRDRAARHATARELELALAAFARNARLDLSPASMARYMEQLFQKDVDLWRRALVGGQALPAIVSRKIESTTQNDETPTAPQDAARGIGDETKSAAVTETLTPERRSRLSSLLAVLVMALGASAAAVALLGRNREATSPLAPDAAGISAAQPPAVEPQPEPIVEPGPVAAPAGAEPAPTTSASQAAPSMRKLPPLRRPKPASTAKPKPAPRDPDAPLPR